MTLSFPDFVQAWNEAQGLGTPGHHREIAVWLDRCWMRGERRLLLLAFRNSGKSTLLGLFAAWLLHGDPNRRILTLSADLALARKLARNARRVIERHPRTEGLKPPRADQWSSEQFTVLREAELRDPSMLARGILGNITGSHADIVICDDVEVPRSSDTPLKREELRERLAEIDYVLTPGGFQLYAGTPHSFYSLYAASARPDIGEEAPFLEGFTRMEVPLLNPDGSSAWPERFDLDEIERIRLRHGPNRFASQMLLQPLSPEDGRLNPDLLPPYDAEPEFGAANGEAVCMLEGVRMIGVRCWWDPAYGAPGAGDSSVVAAVFEGADRVLRIHRVLYVRTDPLDPAPPLAQQCRQVVAFAAALRLPFVMVEKNGIGGFVPGELRRAMGAAGVGCTVVEDASVVSKERRILDAFDAPLNAGRLRAHRSLFETPFLTEMREWRPAGGGARRGGRDDGLDAVAGAILCHPPRNLPARLAPRRADWRPGAGQFMADTRFAV